MKHSFSHTCTIFRTGLVLTLIIKDPIRSPHFGCLSETHLITYGFIGPSITCWRCRPPCIPNWHLWCCYMLNESGLMLATELILRTRPFIFRSMSSSVLPCVSGTQNRTKKKPMNTIPENSQNVPWAEIQTEGKITKVNFVSN